MFLKENINTVFWEEKKKSAKIGGGIAKLCLFETALR